MTALFTTGGFVRDNAVAADGAVSLGGMGGNALYSAAGARLWTGPVGCVGLVPRGSLGAWQDRVRGAGLDASGLHGVDDECEDEWFFHRPDGSRVDKLHAPASALATFGVSAARIGIADARRFEAHLQANPGRSGFRIRHPVEPCHVPPRFWRPGVGMHLAPNRPDAQIRLMQRGRKAGAVISFDPGLHAGRMTPADLDAALQCDAVLPSEKELRLLAPDQALADAVRYLSARGPAVVACKLGRDGSVVHDRRSGETHHVPAVPTAAPDPTGAGDAYCGGFLAGWLHTADPVAAACCGTVSASFAVEAYGPARLLAAERAEAVSRLHRLVERVTCGAGLPALDRWLMGASLDCIG